jgi:acetolactate synthase I/II/III large subunit
VLGTGGRRQLPGALLSWPRSRDPDFAAYARAFGAYGELVETTEHSRPRSNGRFSAGRPALLELRLAAEAITPSTTLSAIRDEALKQTPRQRRGSPH